LTKIETQHRGLKINWETDVTFAARIWFIRYDQSYLRSILMRVSSSRMLKYLKLIAY
jgi:hypothetical protein